MADRSDGATGGRRSAGARPGRAARTRPPVSDPVAQLAGPLGQVLARLPATQRELLEWRMGLKDGHPHDLAETARALGLGQAEAREIERRAFDHIREVVPPRLQKLLDR